MFFVSLQVSKVVIFNFGHVEEQIWTTINSTLVLKLGVRLYEYSRQWYMAEMHEDGYYGGTEDEHASSWWLKGSCMISDIL